MKTLIFDWIMRRHLWMLCCLLGLVACKDDKADNNETYNPNEPVEVTGFLPKQASGGAQFIIYGSNFGSDLDNLKVTVNDKEAVLISSNGSCIYCFVPKKAGNGEVKVTVGTDNTQQEATAKESFEYIPSLVVKTLSGHIDIDGNSSITDGSFEEAQFEAPYWLAMDDEDHLYLVEDYRGLRRLDMKERKVTTLWRTGSGVDHPRAISFNADHSELYIFNDQGNDEGIAVAVSKRSIDPKKEDFNSWSTVVRNQSCCGGAVHPETNDLFFNRWNGGEFYKWNFEKKEKELIFRLDNQFNPTVTFAPSGKFAYIVVIGHHCVYRSNFNYETGLLMQPYILCGSKGNSGYVDGPGSKAQFNEPQQGCFDEDDNFYLCDQSNDLIRKIEPNGQVTTFAGRYQDWGLADGDLRKEARFDRPHGIAYNKTTGEFYIADKNNKRIRIITKE
jgi:DNA-binding beta-propeller fold protein YncE